ncbi:uncharacterized protein F5147DRAFT_600785 [Suillus discolor]|uniref:Uncharacterized protein n=1 Tax=Suillus discolor TaxID=1912936 RepID=A0A9P7K1V7_9AGAM|nr:uncharacterized protein F5147DRAFT_600785 [Suillus discolor]KAG2120652.1 hypothetical protein F5147DRAFT_600785 [Suillus discolor]
MSFQHFRLGQLALSQPLPPHLQQNQQQTYSQNPPSSTSTPAAPSSLAIPAPPKSTTARSPYGCGDSDDGYTLIFPNLAAFQEWRAHEEETQMVEFVKGDTHGSKAVPPRFKDHTKLVCARHSRSGRKKYVKKHPERVRKVPSRKLDGQGCLASISYKTYYDTDEVRVCYIAEHSHPIGLANLPFTRRGRRQTVLAEKEESKRALQAASTAPAATQQESSSTSSQTQVQNYPSNPPLAHLPHPFSAFPGPPAIGYPHIGPPQGSPSQQELWDRMSILFNSIREHARAFDYPGPTVVALESVLIRLYLESPMGVVGGPGFGVLGPSMHGGAMAPHQHQQPQQSHQDVRQHQQQMNGASPQNGEQVVNNEMDSGIESG